jgi:hypothetical protein
MLYVPQLIHTASGAIVTFQEIKKSINYFMNDTNAIVFKRIYSSLGSIVFNTNDFDESVVGDFQMDVWRMSAALLLSNRVHNLLEKDEAPKVGTGEMIK